MAKEIPINSRIIEQMAKATIKNINDAIVEFVTNCDDSYRRLEEKGQEMNGEIFIEITRRKGGKCEEIVVTDFAEGMSKEELERALEFAGETSGFTRGKSVRGFFGRGLKESIIALGTGEIRTIKNGYVYRTRVWWDGMKAHYDDKLLEEIEETEEKSGTKIKIKVTNDKLKVARYEKFKNDLSRHFALRDILSSEKRKVKLFFVDGRNRNEHKITFSYPAGKKVKEEEVVIPHFEDKIRLVIYESEERLDSPRNNPTGLAGILIKTGGAILENQLFKFEHDEAAFYFFGEAYCEALAKRIKEEGILDPNRGGLEWRHEYCKALANTIEKVLEPLVLEKKKDLSAKKTPIEIKDTTKKLLNRLRNKLNELAKKVLDESFDETEISYEDEIDDLLIKPEKVNVEVGKQRILSVYAPGEIVRNAGERVYLEAHGRGIRTLASEMVLKEHPHKGETYYGYFHIVADAEDSEGTIIAQLGDNKSYAIVKVAPPGEKAKGRVTGKKGGFFRDIIPDETDNPIQRVEYSEKDGIIKIYVNFPPTARFIGSGLVGVEKPEGRMLLAELVGEAFCKATARKRIETGDEPALPNAEIETYNRVINEHQRYLTEIYDIVFSWDFGERN